MTLTKEIVILSRKELDRVSILERLERREMGQKDAAKILNRTTRQVRRLQRQYRAQGAAGIASKKRGRPSNHRLADAIREQIPKVIAEHYHDFGPTLATEKLAERHAIQVSVESVRQLMIEHELWLPQRRRRTQIHRLRPPRPCFGEMIQVDGSPHAWFEDRAPECCLIVFIDDATSRVVAARFYPHETTEAYMAVLRSYLVTYGRPVSIYSDRHSIFRITSPEPRNQGSFTQFGRVLDTLDIEPIHAQSPQAKGRVERVNRTLQDRLVKEMRLAGISSIESANEFLVHYLDGFNRRFAKPPLVDVDAHRKVLHKPHDLDLIFAMQFQRTVSKTLTVQFNNTVYQLTDSNRARRLMRTKVIVCQHFDGHVTLLSAGKSLPYEIYERGHPLPEVVDDKQVNARVERAKKNQARSGTLTPPPDHPWRKWAFGSITKEENRRATAQ